MRRAVGVVAVMGVLGLSAVGTAEAEPVPRATISWGPCTRAPSMVERLLGVQPRSPEDGEPMRAGVECATVRVPLDHREPYGQSIKLALNRIKGKVSRDHNHLGTLLVNPGGPGASGRELAGYVAAALPADLADRFDIIGFDPRGVGRSEPSLRCVDPDKYFAPPRPDHVPKTAREEAVLVGRAQGYAARCGDLWAWMLPHLATEDSARDLDVIRRALGEEQISYLGYSYGTYLGAAYATLFPERVKRLVLDSSVNPDEIWYRANLSQDRSFDRRHREFLSWTARNRKVYKLGKTFKQTSFAWYSMRERLRAKPAGGVVGPSELDELYTVGGYTDAIWPQLAAAWSRYVRKGEVAGLVSAFRHYVKIDASTENSYAVYLGVQCRDAAWPRDWSRWRADMTALHRKAPFLTWSNAWYNAPCAFWAVPGGEPLRIEGSSKLPPVLMVQARGDAATPYQGAVAMMKRFPTARMVVDPGGNHGLSLAGNACVDRALARYLEDATLPVQTHCPKQAGPRPAERLSAGGRYRHERLTEILGVRG
ncbi:alpha/beta hydrolase [Nonomuraea sp. NPDC050328]|uniref:alpha/beta hydrolase n=1 Tax=Nonomuraea sp. NPDC050328 TaxID=3364361 RepID=UPI0037BD2D73